MPIQPKLHCETTLAQQFSFADSLAAISAVIENEFDGQDAGDAAVRSLSGFLATHLQNGSLKPIDVACIALRCRQAALRNARGAWLAATAGVRTSALQSPA